MRVPIPLVGPTYESRELPLSAQRSKNIYASIDPEARSIVSHHAFPGLKEWGTTAAGEHRGSHKANEAYYTVSGTSLYRVDASGAGTRLGAVPGSGRCDFASDYNHLVVVGGNDAYQLDLSSAEFRMISDPDLIGPTTVDFLNGHFIYDTQTVQGAFIVSDLNDPDSIQSADEATAESHPDDILRIKVHNQLVHFFGSESIEPWFNTGTGNPPFDRVQGAVKQYGIASKWSVANYRDDLFFLDEARVPRRMRGLEVVGIGNNALGKEWQTYSTVADAVGFAFELDHQTFFVLTFPTADRTWLYHEPSNNWFQLSDGVNDSRWLGASYQYCYEKHLVADHSNGKVYELDFDTYTDNGTTIQRMATGAVLWDQTRRFITDAFELDIETGVGLPEGQGSEPLVVMDFSDDGGATWSTGDTRSLGKIGRRETRAVWRRLGQSRERTFRILISDPVKVVILGAYARLRPGRP